MFKKFDAKNSVSGTQQLKSSVQKSIRNQIVEDYPGLKDFIDDILPKKENFKLIKCHEHVELIAGPSGDLLFFKARDGPFMPTLRLIHQYPFILPRQQVDKGAIKFILKGSNIMCPGLTSPGARLTKPMDAGRVVAVTAENKEHALAVGTMSMSAAEIAKHNAGIGIENVHYLNDGLWALPHVK